MPRNYLFGITAMIFCTLIVSCKQKHEVDKGFYYSNPVFRMDNAQQDYIRQAGIKKIYIKFFDVVWNEWQMKPLPLAMLKFDSTSFSWLKQSGLEIIPVVSINNDCLEKIVPDKANALAERINFLLNDLLTAKLITSEKRIHFDCDWKPEAKETYFATLTYLRLLPFFQHKEISVSLRSHHINADMAGLPPANRGVLMVEDPEQVEVIKDKIKNYPLPLDAMVITGDFIQLKRNQSINGIINTIEDSVWQQPQVSLQESQHYLVQHDTLLSGYYLKKGDIIEKMSSHKAGAASKALQPILPFYPLTIIAFQASRQSTLDTAQLNAVYSNLNKK